MSSIYQLAMGADFARLHPQIQRRFGFASDDRTAAIGRGVMQRVGHGRFWYDDATKRFRIKVEVANPRWGPLFGYEGSFEVEWRETASDRIPGHAKPRREERRE